MSDDKTSGLATGGRPVAEARGPREPMAKTDFKSVDEYVAAQPAASQPVLQRVRDAVRKALPGAREVISYQIPAYRSENGLILFFAGWRAHYSLYPASAALVAEFAAALAPYEVEKATIRFPLDGRVPVRLIARIAKFRAREAAQRAAEKGARPTARRSTPRPVRGARARAVQATPGSRRPARTTRRDD